MWNTDEIVFKSYNDWSPNYFHKHVYIRAFWHWLTGTTSGRPTYTSYSLRRWRWLYDDERTSKLLRTADRTLVAGIPMRKRGADSLRTAAGQVPDTVCILYPVAADLAHLHRIPGNRSWVALQTFLFQAARPVPCSPSIRRVAIAVITIGRPSRGLRSYQYNGRRKAVVRHAAI